MGIGDDIKNTAEKVTGKVKEGLGKATGNEDLENEGRAEQVEAAAHKAVDDTKDAARKAAEGVKDAAKDARDAFER